MNTKTVVDDTRKQMTFENNKHKHKISRQNSHSPRLLNENIFRKKDRVRAVETEGTAHSVGRGHAMGRHDLEMYRHHDHQHDVTNYTESSTSRSDSTRIQGQAIHSLQGEGILKLKTG